MVDVVVVVNRFLRTDTFRSFFVEWIMGGSEREAVAAIPEVCDVS